MKLKLVLVAVAVATLSACGGGSSPAPAPAPVPTPAAPAAPLSSYTGGPVTDGGTISGTATYAGTETDTTVTINKDNQTCEMHPGETTHAGETLVVADGKLANVIVWIDGITKGKDVPAGSVEINNEQCRFVPHCAIGRVGGKVAAKNSDPILHNTNLSFTEGGKSIANIALPTQGQSVEKDLRKPGLVSVKCDAHAWMQSWLLVTDHPYAAVTDATGAFSLTDVPAGSYTLKFWHEKLGEKSVPVTVTAGAVAAADQAF